MISFHCQLHTLYVSGSRTVHNDFYEECYQTLSGTLCLYMPIYVHVLVSLFVWGVIVKAYEFELFI